MSKSLLLSALVGSTMAQTTVMDLFLPGFDNQALVGSVMTANPTMAQYFVACPGGEDASDCGAGPGVTVTMRPGNYGLDIDGGDAVTMTEQCQIDQGTAICTASIGGTDANDPGVQTVTSTDIDSSDFFLAVTITAGLEKLAAATATGSTTASSGASSTAAAAKSGVSSTAAAQTSSGTGTSGAKATSVSTGGAPIATQHVVLAGVAALVGGVLAM
ncbi:Uu.00g025970.m01.CDS01 [Anthostomella pinea]|uniref:Uu.00g025970.m01.CDS01 n=1 Tax=Anthostomella pinea TaxID=933095 RepID=A0AAI8V7E7_9PEZI|nr:Uu.00g025970.m01.CDS01 [Anthostomella pinea]